MEKLNLKRSDWIRILILVVLAFLYLSPGGGLMFEGRKDRVMSDGSDPATMPYNYGILIDHLHNSPSNLLYGAVPTDRLNPPEGFSLWFSWSEKIVVSFSSMFIALEQNSTFYVWVLFALTGISFYLMARVFGWSQNLSLALAICWAFNAYTRGRAKVHMGMAGTYHLPLMALGLYLAVTGKSRKSLALAAACLLIASTVVQLYIVILAFLAPFFVAYIALMPEAKDNPKRAVSRTLIASLPAIALLLWSVAKPIPASWVKPGTITYARTGETENGQRHPFLNRFASQAIDYFTGEIAIGTNDINPIRAWMSKSVLANLGDSNSHERSNGVRWFIWIAFGIAIWALTEKNWKEMWSQSERRTMWLFVIYTFFCIWLSMAPNALPIPGPSGWLYALVSQFRVPSRAGMFAHFGMLIVAGYFLHGWIDRTPAARQKLFGKKERQAPVAVLWPKVRNKLALAGVLPVLALLELPPLLNDMPIARVSDQRLDLADGKDCGYGLYYPYVSGTWGLLEYYYFLQSMRGSKCKIINAVSDTTSDRNKRFMQSMPLHEKYLAFVQQNPAGAKAQLVDLARCLPMDWIVFDPKIAKPFMADVCSTLGFEQTSADTCRSRERQRPVVQTPESCLR